MARRRFRYKPKRKRRRRQTGMKVKHKNMLWGAGAVTAFFVAFPTYFSALYERIRGGQS